MPVPPFLLPALITAGSAVVTNVHSALEAQRNRRFQERMSSTSHQREVRDLTKAGLNPILSAHSGASTPAGAMAQIEDVGGKGVATALQIRALDAEIDLKRAQAEGIRATTETTSGSREFVLDKLRSDAQRGRLGAEHDEKMLRELLPQMIAKAKEEVGLTRNSAEAQRARAVLDDAAAQGARNIEELEKRLGEMSPWVRLAFEAIRVLSGAGRLVR